MRLFRSSEKETVLAVLVGVTREAGQTGLRGEMEDRMEAVEEDRMEAVEEANAVSELETEETSARGEITISAKLIG